MAKMIDAEPKYEGEKKVWKSFSLNLPQHWVVYNNRSVNGREYDFCVIAPEIGLFIVEVKGWNASGILTVVNQNTIFLAGKEKAEDSPRGQARGYRFELLNKLNRELGMNPLVMSLVCYPFISEKQYFDKGLNVVSETNETIFDEDLSDPAKLYQKLIDRYNVDKGAKHDDFSKKNLALFRHHFEPTYDLKSDEEELNPGYSRLRTICKSVTDETVNTIVEEYFKGIKEIVFVTSRDDLVKIVKAVEEEFKKRKIYPDKGNLVIGEIESNIDKITNNYNVFNFEINVVSPDVLGNADLLIEEGRCTKEEIGLLRKLSDVSSFNIQQYEIEHATTDNNILVTAGAGTGKTFSMVSRIAYLCNRTADAVVDISGEIAMITFTKDAADNMKSRLKKMFMNYFILTSNEKYMHLIEDMNQIQISTIHKFAISLLQKDCMRMGLGYDSQITNETYNRKQLYHQFLNEFIIEKQESNPEFLHQLNIPTYQIEEMLVSFCDKLYDRSIDIKNLSISDFGSPISSMPYFNELIEKVMMKAEREYANQLKRQNQIGLHECMIQFSKLVNSGKITKQGQNFKYVFVDEFQDTDDVQIDTITGLQKLFGQQCKLFVVGDLKQSIYRFRGASLSAFDKVTAAKGIGEWSRYSLNRNYRTDRRLLDRYHSVFTKMGEKGLLPYVEEQDRLASTLVKEYSDDNILSMINTHGKNKDGFYEDLFSAVTDQRNKLEELCTKYNLKPEEKTIAILVRYNWQITNIVKEAKKRDISVRVTEGGDLYRIVSTTDLYALVMAITHPTNKVYLANLIRSNYVSLRVDLAKISGFTGENKTDELVYLLDEYFMLYMGKTWNMIVSDFESRPVLVALRDIYEATKPWTRFRGDEEKLNYRENYDCLIEKLTRWFSREYLTINMVYDFLKINITTYQEEASRNDNSESSDITIICTTIHKSKGLEYGTVILPFTNEDISNIHIGGLNVNVIGNKVTYSLAIDRENSDYSGGFDDNTEINEKKCEESRILYVALTRAIRNLVWLHDEDVTIDDSWGSYMEEGN